MRPLTTLAVVFLLVSPLAAQAPPAGRGGPPPAPRESAAVDLTGYWVSVIVEDWKWRGTPTFEHGGIVCTGETYKQVVKFTFHRGAALDDQAGLFNSSLEGNTRRAIDIREGEEIDEEALKDLVRAAVALNESKGKR